MTKQQALLLENLSLKKALAVKDAAIQKSKKEIERLNELVRYFQQMKFGPSSEKSKQLKIFNEAEDEENKDGCDLSVMVH